jgi:hypothetical protein
MNAPALATLLFLAAAAPLAAQAPVPLTIASASGQARVAAPGGAAPALAAAGTAVAPGSEITTGDNGEVTLIVFPRLAITLKANTRLRVEERSVGSGAEGSSALIDLPEGRIVVLVSDPPAGQPAGEIDLQIRTPQGIARPRGTFYAVLVKDGKSYLAVREGMVGLEQFQPLEMEAAAEVEEALPVRSYGTTTTTSPRG